MQQYNNLGLLLRIKTDETILYRHLKNTEMPFTDRRLAIFVDERSLGHSLARWTAGRLEEQWFFHSGPT